MVGIKDLSQASICPTRFINEITNSEHKKNPNDGNSNSQNIKKDQNFSNDSMEKITQGVIFELAIQNVMTSQNSEGELDRTIQWLRNTRKKVKTCLKDSKPPWEKEMNIKKEIYEYRLSRNKWLEIFQAVDKWKRTQPKHPWHSDKVNWIAEKKIGGKIEFSNQYQVMVNGFIDLYGEGINKNYIVELKFTSLKYINTDKAQASLYTLLFKSPNLESKLKGWVFHHQEGIIQPFTDEYWSDLIEKGKNGNLYPTIYSCKACKVENCIERFNQGV